MNTSSVIPAFRVSHIGMRLAALALLLFIVGSLISRSLADFSKFFGIVVSVGYFRALFSARSTSSYQETKAIPKYIIVVLMFLSSGLAVYGLGWTIYYFDGELLVYLLLGQVWPLMIVFAAWKKMLFSDKEMLYWWFFNGLLWWVIISFAFRNLGHEFDGDAARTHFEISRHQLRGLLDFAFSFTLPFTLFYFFFKMIRTDKVVSDKREDLNKYFRDPLRAAGIAAIVSLTILVLMGIPSLLSLSDYWEGWRTISKSLGLSYNPSRLSSFHFVLDLGNIIAQGLFITLAGVLSRYFFVFKKVGEHQAGIAVRNFLLGLGFCLFLLMMFVFTWTKLLISLVLILLLIFTTIVYRRNYRYFIGVLVGLGLMGGVVLTTDNKLSEFSEDLVKSVQTFQNHRMTNTPSLVDDLIEADLTYGQSFVYRLQHYIWGWRILLIDPLTGVGPYGYTDYVVDNFTEDLFRLPDIILSEGSVSQEVKKTLIASKTDINRSLLGTHADWVMIVSSGGIPGMIFYYGWFGLLIVYFIKRYFQDKDLMLLGMAFALLSMLASGITEPNFKTVHFHFLALYSLIFMGTKFLGLRERYPES